MGNILSYFSKNVEQDKTTMDDYTKEKIAECIMLILMYSHEQKQITSKSDQTI